MGDEAIVDAFLAKGSAATDAATTGGALATDGANVDVAVPDGTKNRSNGKKRTTLKSAVGVADKTEKTFGAVVPDVDSVPVPTGGVALLLLIALIVVFAIMTAPGQNVTRLRLIWLALLGNATLGDGAAGGSVGGTIASTYANPALPTWAAGAGQVAGYTQGGQWGMTY